MHLKSFMSVVLFITVVTAAVPVSAQTADQDVARLSLDQCLRMALANNLELVSARYSPQLAEESVRSQDAAFDPVFDANLSHFESQALPTQGSTAASQTVDRFDFGVTQELKFGANYSARWITTEIDQVVPNALVPSFHRSFLQLDYTQPILRGAGKTVTTEQLILARNDVEISRSDLEGKAENILEQVEGAYWDVVAAREALRTQRLALQRAEDLLELNRKKVEVGTLAPIEITQAEAGVASEVENVIIAETNLENAEDELRRLLAIPRGDRMWTQSIYNTTQPNYRERRINLDEAIDTALVNRPEMAAAQQNVSNRELNERVAKREARSQLDAVLNYTPLGTDVNEIRPGYEDAISNIISGDEFSWSAALVYRIPIGNRLAKSNYSKARISRSQAQVDLDNQEQTIRVEVRRSVRGVEQGIKRVDAAIKNVELQQKKLDAEQKKFENGMSTSFEVLSFQKDLADAELSEIRAKLNYIKSLAALERSQGTLLEKHGLTISAAD